MTRDEAMQILSTRDAHGVLCGHTSGVKEALDMAIEALQAEPVKRGKWINIFDNTWECTNCETCEQFGYNIESTSDYCPNCGAKMEVEHER